FMRVIDQIRARLNAKPVPIVLPIGAEDSFRGVVDLLRMKAIYWHDETQGMTYDEVDVPAEMLGEVQSYREQLIEVAAEASEELMDKYLEEGELAEGEIVRGLRMRTIAGEIVPALCGSAFKNKGVQRVLDAVIEFLPSPVDIPPVKGTLADGEPAERKADDNEPFSALAFKVAADPFVGTLTFFRCYSGVVNSGDTVLNSTRNKRERFGRIVQMHANHREEVKEVRAGDIAAAIGLKDVTTGDTLCSVEKPIILEKMDFPEPVISVAVEPKTKNDQEKMGIALQRLAQEDPSFRVRTD